MPSRPWLVLGYASAWRATADQVLGVVEARDRDHALQLAQAQFGVSVVVTPATANDIAKRARIQCDARRDERNGGTRGGARG